MQKVTLSFPWPVSAAEMREILTFAFQLSLVTYLGMYLVESLQPGFVTVVLALNPFIVATVVFGALASIWPAVAQGAGRKKPLRWSHYAFFTALALLSGFILWDKTRTIGWGAGGLAVLAAGIVFSLGLLSFLDRNAGQ